MASLGRVLHFQNSVKTNISDLTPYSENPNLRNIAYGDMKAGQLEATEILRLIHRDIDLIARDCPQPTSTVHDFANFAEEFSKTSMDLKIEGISLT